jgi:hypothetical protein
MHDAERNNFTFTLPLSGTDEYCRRGFKTLLDPQMCKPEAVTVSVTGVFNFLEDPSLLGWNPVPLFQQVPTFPDFPKDCSAFF